MTVHSIHGGASVRPMIDRCINPQCASPAIDDVDHNGLCLICALVASNALAAARPDKPIQPAPREKDADQ